MTEPIEIRPEVREALAAGCGVVALESTVIAHGLPPPQNLEVARRLETAVRAAGAVPATIAVLDGRLVIGLGPEQLERLATGGAAKASRRDLAALLASGADGATTVAATAFAAARAGIRLLATGGLGGVHRGGERTLDVSADLPELARSGVAVVCSGAKAVLDLPRTLEALETLGVAVVGYRTSELPAFYSRGSGLPLEHRVDSPAAAARLLALQRRLDPRMGVVLANPPPAAAALPRREVEGWIAEALEAAESAGLHGAAVTPFLLARLAEASGGRAVAANRALLEANARLAAEIAVAAETLTDDGLVNGRPPR